MTAPWDGKSVTWTIDGEEHTASYGPQELLMMRTARERGATTSELECVHLLKALVGATIVNAEAPQ